ncbi:MAG: tetratricopeptide repeat protein [Desulfobacterales bacterium]|nr:tetratricopeptide repeat protein [Desulfobacterales bacterium]
MTPGAPIPAYAQGPSRFRYPLAALILLGAAVSFYGLSCRLAAEYYRYRANVVLESGHSGLAAQALRQAIGLMPRDGGMHKALASIYDRMGQSVVFKRQNRMWAKKAKAAFAEAFRLNPLDAEAAIGLARAESRLEQFQRAFDPGRAPGPYDARPYFKSALALRPNGIPFHFALIQHLDRISNAKESGEAVERLCRIYPAAYDTLRKAPYWKAETRAAAARGLRKAIDSGIDPRTAHFSLSAIAVEEGQWDLAATHYEEALEHQSRAPGSAQNIKLGGFYLRQNRLGPAQERFLDSLAGSRTMEKDLTPIYQAYVQSGHAEDFNPFYDRARQRFSLPPGTDILLARSHLAAKQYGPARRLLETRSAEKPTPRAWYWLARIAEAEKDWDRMELAIQKATVLDPGNVEYRKIFLRLLMRQGKYRTAETQLDWLIGSAQAPSAALFHERAQLRYRQERYAEAASDWQAAARLEPRRADFWAHAGEAATKQGDWRRAEEYYRRAVNVSPKNSRYQEQLRRLQGAG